MSQEIAYQVGGVLDPNHVTYVYRKADSELFDHLVKGEYCYVLNSRQMGKSSLAAKTKVKLEENGIIAPIVDLSSPAGDATREQWYFAIANLMMEYVQIPNFDWNDYWNNLPLDAKDRLGELIKQILRLSERNLVIFLDEIDSLGLLKNFSTDDLLTYIRSCFNYRATLPIFNRLTFCLIGVRTPGDIVQNKNITSFNIGNAVELNGFTVQEAEPLTTGLQKKFGQPQSKTILETIINEWTNGQPFLTQKLCKLVLEKAEPINPDIPALVGEYIIKNWDSEKQDYPVHLRHIRDRVLDDEQRAVRLLEMYKEILVKGEIAADDSYDQTELRLSGLVLRKERTLKPFNRIYEKVFNLEWVNEQLAKIRPYSAKFEAWLTAIEEQKQLYLLYGEELKVAQHWKKGKNLQSEDYTFLNDSQNFWDKAQERLPEGCNYEAIIEAMKPWSGGQKFFNDIIFDILRGDRRRRNPPEKGTEEKWVEGLVRSDLIKNCKSEKVREHLKKISDRLLKNPNADSFIIMFSYQQILQFGEITFNTSPEHQELIDMCLTSEKDNKLRIFNKIYEDIFNQSWLNKKLPSLRPYAEAFKAWETSGCNDESLLLKEQDLQTALDWIQNKEQLNELELEFIITSLVWEMWQSATNPEMQKAKTEAVEIVKRFRPQLQEKTNHPDRLIREILRWTRIKPFLLKELLQWVCDSQIIPVGNEVKWLEQLVRSHIKDWNAQKLAKGLDLNDPSNDRWRELKDENDFIFIDEVLRENNFSNSEKDIQEVKRIVKKYQKILDEHRVLSINRHDADSVTNFQRLILASLYSKFRKVYNMLGQKEFDALLDDIVKQAGGDLEAVLIFNLKSGYVQYHNKELKSNNPDLYHILYGTGDGGKASQNLKNLKTLQNDLDSFGNLTKFGSLEYCMFKLTQGIMVAYFMPLSDTTVAICFIAPEGIRPGTVDFHCSNNIQKIKEQLKDF